MRCFVCAKLSFFSVCTDCQKIYLRPSIKSRTLSRELKVYSFYGYDEISKLLLAKHKPVGHSIFNILAKNSFAPFAKELDHNIKALAVPIDDHVKSGYSHTAILAKHLRSPSVKPTFGKLLSTNSVTYSGQSLEFRQQNPRKFDCQLKMGDEVILVDDIVTTGTTLLEAASAAEECGAEVLFALTLADAKEF